MIRLSYDETMDRIELHIRAGSPILYLISLEETRMLENIARVIRVIRARERGSAKNLVTFFDGAGLVCHAGLTAPPALPKRPDGGIDWLEIEGQGAGLNLNILPQTQEPVNALKSFPYAEARGVPDSVAVFFDLYPWLDARSMKGSEAVRPLRKAADKLRELYAGRKEGGPYRTIIVVAPTAQDLPAELLPDIVKIEFPLPEVAELKHVLTQLHKDKPFTLSDPELLNGIAEAGRGLPLEKFRSALNIFRVRGNELTSQHVNHLLELKAEAVAAELALHFTPEVRTSLRGLKAIEEWVKLREEGRTDHHLPPPRGLLLCGASGGGKSEMAKFVAQTFGQALLRLDVGLLFGSYIGESEENTRRTLQLAEALAPIVLWLDEIDKAFSGLDGAGDSGVARRVFGQFLTWMQERRAPVFVVATANDIEPLYERFTEFFRSGRWDQIIFVNLPSPEARRQIFRVYLAPFWRTAAEQPAGGADETPQPVAEGGAQPLASPVPKRGEARFLQITGDMVIALARQIDDLTIDGEPPPNDDGELFAALSRKAQSEAAKHSQTEKQTAATPPDLLETLCWVLGHDHFSGQMTGAEIEKFVEEARWEAFKRSRQAETKSAADFSAALLGELLTGEGGAKKRALYDEEGDAFVRLKELLARARRRHWVIIE